MSYGSGGFSGEEYTDTVTLSPDLVITNQGVAVASSSLGFDGFDGILGYVPSYQLACDYSAMLTMFLLLFLRIGPTALTGGTVSDGSLVPTVLDNAYSQGLVDQDVIGISFAPASSEDPSGVLTFGGVDESRTAGPINYVCVFPPPVSNIGRSRLNYITRSNAARSPASPRPRNTSA